jgi:hypothetical protein
VGPFEIVILLHPRETVALWQHGEKESKEKVFQKEASAET